LGVIVITYIGGEMMTMITYILLLRNGVPVPRKKIKEVHWMVGMRLVLPMRVYLMRFSTAFRNALSFKLPFGLFVWPARLPDFSSHNIPKRWKIYQITTTLPNFYKIFQMTVKFSNDH
jgi:hypothetical protein